MMKESIEIMCSRQIFCHEIYLMFSSHSLTIEKKLLVEDFRVLRERFIRTTVDDFDYTAKENNKTAGE